MSRFSASIIRNVMRTCRSLSPDSAALLVDEVLSHHPMLQWGTVKLHPNSSDCAPVSNLGVTWIFSPCDWCWREMEW